MGYYIVMCFSKSCHARCVPVSFPGVCLGHVRLVSELSVCQSWRAGEQAFWIFIAVKCPTLKDTSRFSLMVDG